MQLILQIIDGPNTGQKIWIRPGQMIEVGRSELNNLAISGDPQISTVHFALEFGDEICTIRDKNSTNGTFVNGQRVEKTDLHDGDRIVAGQSTFSVHITGTTKASKTLPPANISETLLGSATESSTRQRTPAAGQSAPGDAESTPSNQTEDSNTSVGAAVSRADKSSQDGISSERSKPVGNLAKIVNDDENLESVDSASELLEVVNETDFAVAAIPWENARGEGRLTVIVKATFTIVPGGVARVADQQLPVFTADEPFDDEDPNSPLRFETDMVPFKPRTDVVLVGRACAPRKRAVSQLDVRLRVGTLQKTIRVFGDRRWSFPTSLAIVPRMSKPEPFVEMELGYQRAFGGIDQAAAAYCKKNLAGVGFIGKLAPKSIHQKTLPNLEDPDDLIYMWESHPKPVGFGFYGRGWMPRLKYAGTYDEQHQKERAPLPPKDFSYEFYNGAHPDLQVEGFLQGGENVELQNLTPEGDVQFRLPRIRPLVTITRIVSSTGASFDSSGGSEETVEPQSLREEKPVPTVFDTLVFVPDEAIFYEVFRAVFSLPDLENPDVARIKITAGVN